MEIIDDKVQTDLPTKYEIIVEQDETQYMKFNMVIFMVFVIMLLSAPYWL